jgi:hypothetical protein
VTKEITTKFVKKTVPPPPPRKTIAAAPATGDISTNAKVVLIVELMLLRVRQAPRKLIVLSPIFLVALGGAPLAL